jgi:hypothetical protein
MLKCVGVHLHEILNFFSDSWRYITRIASPIDPELAYNYGSTEWKQKKGKNKREIA